MQEFVTALQQGNCTKIRKDNTSHYQLLSHPAKSASMEDIIDHFLATQLFDYSIHSALFKQIQVLEKEHFNKEDYQLFLDLLEGWVNWELKVMLQRLFNDPIHQFTPYDAWPAIIKGAKIEKPIELKSTQEATLQIVEEVMAFFAIYSKDYKAKELALYLKIIQALHPEKAAEIQEKLKQLSQQPTLLELHSNEKEVNIGTLPLSIGFYKDEQVILTANDEQALLKIIILKEEKAAYDKALDFILKVMEHGFPKSWEFRLKAKEKKVFPIDEELWTPTDPLHFFANVIHYPALLPKVEKFVKLMTPIKWSWYTNRELDYYSAKPGTFALLGLYLQGDYFGIFDLYEEFLWEADTEHQRMALLAIGGLEVLGVQDYTCELLCNTILESLNFYYHKNLTNLFENQKALELLLENKTRFLSFHDGKKRRAKEDWGRLLLVVFGTEELPDAYQQEASPEMKELYQQVFSKF